MNELINEIRFATQDMDSVKELDKKEAQDNSLIVVSKLLEKAAAIA